jgi:hypothetical protein
MGGSRTALTGNYGNNVLIKFLGDTFGCGYSPKTSHHKRETISYLDHFPTEYNRHKPAIFLCLLPQVRKKYDPSASRLLEIKPFLLFFFLNYSTVRIMNN